MEDLRDIQNKINKLDSDKLFQIVKNYHQYGYSEDIRKYALEILEQRGITIQDLKLTGNFENYHFEEAKKIYLSFKQYSKIAFIAYLLLVSSRLFKFYQYISSDFMSWGYIIISLLLLAVFIICLFKSFISQSDFYKSTGDDYSDGALIYFLLGVPLYIIMYFVFANQMSEKIKSIT